MGFDARKAVVALDYDFTTATIADEETKAILADAKGTVPEPTQDTLDNFTEALRGMVAQEGIADVLALGEDPSNEAVIAAIGKLPEGAIKGATEGMTEAVIDLCQGSPSAEQIRALPPRIRMEFISWLSEALMGPTKRQPASGPSRVGAGINGASAT